MPDFQDFSECISGDEKSRILKLSLWRGPHHDCILSDLIEKCWASGFPSLFFFSSKQCAQSERKVGRLLFGSTDSRSKEKVVQKIERGRGERRTIIAERRIDQSSGRADDCWKQSVGKVESQEILKQARLISAE